VARFLDIILRGSDKTKGAFDSVEARTRKAETRFGRFRREFGESFSSGLRHARTAAIGVAAVGGAMLAAAKRTETFNKQIGQIATLADISIPKAKQQVKALSAEFGLAKDELNKGLYDALSAGVPKENVFEFLRVAAQGAVAGAASTAESVDILTTAMNAFNIPVKNAGAISDKLFATIKLGKTTMSELAQSFAQVAPLASASGVALDQVLAAAATLTKQGTPTAQAMTQIRAALISMNEHLGDGWTKTMTLQEGMQAMSDKAGGSASALKELTGRVEGTLGILALTGANASMAASDLAKVQQSAGDATEAFGKMDEAMVLSKGQQAIDNLILALGEATFEEFADDIKDVTDALIRLEKEGDIREFARGLTDVMNGLAKAGSAVGFVFRGAQTVGRVGGALGTAAEEARADVQRALATGAPAPRISLTDNVLTRTKEILDIEAAAAAHRRAGDMLPENIKARLEAGELSFSQTQGALAAAKQDNSDIISSQDRIVSEMQENNRILREAISFSR